MLFSWFQRNTQAKQNANEVFLKLADHTRHESFYTDFGVPDDINGHYDLIVLHLFLIHYSLERERSKITKRFNQYLVDHFFSALDIQLRELGLGDPGMARRMKEFMKSYYGRVMTYQKDILDKDALKEALKRNLYNTNPGVSDKESELMILYIQKQIEYFEKYSNNDILSNNFVFMNPMKIVGH